MSSCVTLRWELHLSCRMTHRTLQLFFVALFSHRTSSHAVDNLKVLDCNWHYDASCGHLSSVGHKGRCASPCLMTCHVACEVSVRCPRSLMCTWWMEGSGSLDRHEVAMRLCARTLCLTVSDGRSLSLFHSRFLTLSLALSLSLSVPLCFSHSLSDLGWSLMVCLLRLVAVILCCHGQPSSREDRDMIIRQLCVSGFPARDLSDNELAKTHGRHLVGGRAPHDMAKDERLFRFEFPERPGSLARFLETLPERYRRVYTGAHALRSKGLQQAKAACTPKCHTISPQEEPCMCVQARRVTEQTISHRRGQRHAR